MQEQLGLSSDSDDGDDLYNYVEPEIDEEVP